VGLSTKLSSRAACAGEGEPCLSDLAGVPGSVSRPHICVGPGKGLPLRLLPLLRLLLLLSLTRTLDGALVARGQAASASKSSLEPPTDAAFQR